MAHGLISQNTTFIARLGRAFSVEENNEFISFYLPIISIIISVIAITPVVYSFFKKTLSKITCDFYGFQEIGFTKQGPQLALYTVFRALRSDLYVKNLEVEILHLEENRKIINYMWVFRILKFSHSSTVVQNLNFDQTTSLDVASGFIVSEQQEVKKHIVFTADFQLNPELNPLNDLESEIRDEYALFFREKLMQWDKKIPMIVGENVDSKVYIAEFLERPKTRIIVEKIVEKCWWKEGTYKCLLRSTTTNPNKMFNKEFSFQLDNESIACLKSNANKIVAEFCEKLFLHYDFIYLKLNQ